METGRIQFGIIGCATIAHKLARAILLAPNADVTAVASRSLAKSQRFVTDNFLSSDSVTAYGSNEELLEDSRVNAVYIPLPTSLHVQWATAAAEKKKHVLLEKPAALCVPDLDRILEACERNGVVFMDGSMWAHHPRTARMREVIQGGEFGPVRTIHASSTFLATEDLLQNDIRTDPNLDSLGALGDLGWYCIGAILFAVNYHLPTAVTALPSLRLNQSNVILSCSASLHWEHSDTLATFHCSFLSNVSMDLSVHGTNATIKVKDLAIPYEETSAKFDYVCGAKFADLHLGWTRKPEEVEVVNEAPQEVLMIEEFTRLVRESGTRPDMKWREITRKTQRVMDAVKSSIELGFKTVNL